MNKQVLCSLVIVEFHSPSKAVSFCEVKRTNWVRTVEQRECSAGPFGSLVQDGGQHFTFESVCNTELITKAKRMNEVFWLYSPSL